MKRRLIFTLIFMALVIGINDVFIMAFIFIPLTLALTLPNVKVGE